jgi:hypothetical protein
MKVFICAVCFGGPPPRILDAWRQGPVSLVLSPDVFEEYRRIAQPSIGEERVFGLDAVLGIGGTPISDRLPSSSPSCRVTVARK